MKKYFFPLLITALTFSVLFVSCEQKASPTKPLKEAVIQGEVLAPIDPSKAVEFDEGNVAPDGTKIHFAVETRDLVPDSTMTKYPYRRHVYTTTVTGGRYKISVPAVPFKDTEYIITWVDFYAEAKDGSGDKEMAVFRGDTTSVVVYEGGDFFVNLLYKRD